MKDRPEPPVIEQALSMVRDSTGRIIEIGMFEDIVPLDFMPIVFKQVSVIGSFGFSREDLAQALDLIRTKKVDRQGLISVTSSCLTRPRRRLKLRVMRRSP